LSSNDSAGRAKGLHIFDERAGIPFVFDAIRNWERRLRRFGVKKESSRILAVCSIISLPLALLAIRQLPYRPLTAFWAVWLAMCDSLIVLLSWRSWDAFLETRSSVIDMLQDASDDEVDNLENSYLKVFRRAPQLCVCSLVALITLWAALQLPAPIVQRVPVTIVSLLVSGFVAGHAVYLIINTALMIQKFSRISNLRLRWNDPINTPGLISLSKADQFEAQIGMILFFVVAVPLTYAYVHVHKADIRFLYLCEMFLPLLCIIVIGLVIQGWLAYPARKFKRATLEEFSASINEMRAGRSARSLQIEELARIKEQLEVYELLNNTADSFFRGGVVTQYLASIAAAAIPFIIAFLLQRG
jgi:hypothetical protein